MEPLIGYRKQRHFNGLPVIKWPRHIQAWHRWKRSAADIHELWCFACVNRPVAFELLNREIFQLRSWNQLNPRVIGDGIDVLVGSVTPMFTPTNKLISASASHWAEGWTHPPCYQISHLLTDHRDQCNLEVPKCDLVECFGNLQKQAGLIHIVNRFLECQCLCWDFITVLELSVSEHVGTPARMIHVLTVSSKTPLR